MASIKRIGKDKLGVSIWEAVYRRKSGGKQIRRRYHVASRGDMERTILLDSNSIPCLPRLWPKPKRGVIRPVPPVRRCSWTAMAGSGKGPGF
ncbi:MAG: hypothetical protein FWG74_07435 [Planctomycetes bacterium]|nr:hypothetical protein [Planctomycetota bacterium]